MTTPTIDAFMPVSYVGRLNNTGNWHLVQLSTTSGEKGAVHLQPGVSTVVVNWLGNAELRFRVNSKLQATMSTAEKRKMFTLTARTLSNLDIQILNAAPGDLNLEMGIQITTIPLAPF